MNNLISSLNPFSSKYNALEDFNKLTFLSKLTVIFVTTLASVATAFICTPLVFRLLVGRLKPLDPSKDTSQNDLAKKTAEAAKSVLGQNDAPPNLDLNEETLLHLFSYLDTKSLFKAMQVCRDFRRIGADDTLWMSKVQKLEKELSFYENYLRNNEIAFRMKSPASQPVVTKITKSIDRPDRRTVTYKNIIVNYFSIYLHLYNTKTGKDASLPVPVVNSAHFLEDKLAVGSIGYIEIYDRESFILLKRFEPNENFLNSPVTGVLIQEGKVFGCYHNHLVVWDLETGLSQKYLLGGHSGKISNVFCYEDYVVTYDDTELVVWDLKTESILSQTFSDPLCIYDGELISFRESDNNITLYDFKTQNLGAIAFFSPDDHFKNSESRISVIPFQDQLIIQSRFQITVGDLRENRLLYNLLPYHSLENIEAKFVKVCVCNDKIIASIESELNSKISCWDLKTGTLVFSFPINQKLAGFVLLEEEKAIVCDLIDKLEIWDLEKGVYNRTILIPEKQKNMYAMPEGKLLLDYGSELLLLDFSKEGEGFKPQKSCTLF